MAKMNHLAGKTLASTWNTIGILLSGNRNPESSTVGRNNPIIVIIIASTCVWLMDEMSRPNDAEVSMKMIQSISSISKLPLMGILKTNTLMAMMAMVLAEYAEEQVDLKTVLETVLIHDVVEIEAGDTYAYDAAGNFKCYE